MKTDLAKTFFGNPKPQQNLWNFKNFKTFKVWVFFKGVVMIILRLFLYLENPVTQREVYNF